MRDDFRGTSGPASDDRFLGQRGFDVNQTKRLAVRRETHDVNRLHQVGHVAPEAQAGGPIAALRDGDVVIIDIEKRVLDTELPSSEIASRLAAWKPKPPRYTSGVMAKYAVLVSSASDGAITRPSNST